MWDPNLICPYLDFHQNHHEQHFGENINGPGEMIIRQEKLHNNLLFSRDQQNVKELSVSPLYYMYKMINKISRCGHGKWNFGKMLH